MLIVVYSCKKDVSKGGEFNFSEMPRSVQQDTECKNSVDSNFLIRSNEISQIIQTSDKNHYPFLEAISFPTNDFTPYFSPDYFVIKSGGKSFIIYNRKNIVTNIEYLTWASLMKL